MSQPLKTVDIPACEDHAAMRAELSVDDTGRGDWTLLCVHGFSDNLYTWQALREILEPKGARVIAFDLPGFGQSPLAPEFVDNYSVAVGNHSLKRDTNRFINSLASVKKLNAMK